MTKPRPGCIPPPRPINELTGILPELIIMQGRTADCVTQLLKEDKDISVLVLASGTGKAGPGPLVSSLRPARMPSPSRWCPAS